MNTNSNTYTVIYSTILVVVVAAVLAFAATSLKEKQDENVKVDTISQILTAAGLKYNEGDVLQVADGPHRIGAGGAFVHHQGIAVVHQPGKLPGNFDFGFDAGIFANGIGRSDSVVAAQNCAAIDSGGDSFLFQPLQVPSDGLLRHLEFRAHGGHHHLTGGFDPFRDNTASFCSQQGRHLPASYHVKGII